jgi:hypothetical protein
VRHVFAKPGMPRNLSAEESFEDVSIWKLTYACQSHFPIVSEASQLLTDHVDCEQVLEIQHLAVNFADLVVLVEQQ